MDVIIAPILEQIYSYTYELIVTGVLLFLYLFFKIKLSVTESKSIQSFNLRKFRPAIPTESPVENNHADALKKGIRGLENRFSFIKKALPFALVFLWMVLVFLPQINKIPAAYLSILAAVVSVFAGLAFRPFLENLFAGVVISFFKSVKIGDTVIIDGDYGTIEEIGLTYAVLKKWDWVRIVIPNNRLIQKEIQNLSLYDQYIWAHIEFFVSPHADMGEVEKHAIEAAKSSNYLSDIEDPTFWVIDMQKDCVKCWVAAWASGPGHAWDVRDQTRRALHKILKEKGVLTHQHHWNNNLESQL